MFQVPGNLRQAAVTLRATRPASFVSYPKVAGGSGSAIAGDSHVSLDFGIHRAVGGDHDLPNPGDMLCAALAGCLDSTLRMIAARMGLVLKTLEVEVRAYADVRGCLMVDRQVPAGFQRIDVDVRIEPTKATDPSLIGRSHQPPNSAASFSRPCAVANR